MAKGKKSRRDFEESVSGDAVAGAVVQPQPVLPTASAADGRAILAKLFGFSAEDVASLVKAKEEASVFTMAAQAEEYAQKMKSEVEQKSIRDWASKSCQVRTQAVVDQTWKLEPGTSLFNVRIVKNRDIEGRPESITLEIPAHSDDEARGRYMSVCGIRSTDHFIKATPAKKVKSDPTPPVGDFNNDDDDGDFGEDADAPEGAFVEAN